MAVVKIADFKGEGRGFDTQDRPVLLTSFLPQLHIDIYHFLATTRNNQNT
jgi:hypothetical protein